jgi:sulfoxide reductase heme-binding subunit YedZ
MNRLGFWTLFFLVACLACTPLKIILRRGWPVTLRRGLGLFAFTYGVLHFGVYLGLDQFFDLSAITADIVKRPFITVGFVALLLMVPLAITSTNKMVKRLGAARWRGLHRLAYASAILGVIHFVWRVKSDLREPLLFAAALGLLYAAASRPLRSSSSIVGQAWTR